MQPILLGGAERDAVILVWLGCIGAGALLHPTYLFLPLFVGVGALAQIFLRKLAIADPEMLKVARKHFSQQEYYPAQAHVTAGTAKKGNRINTHLPSALLVRLLGGNH